MRVPTIAGLLLAGAATMAACSAGSYGTQAAAPASTPTTAASAAAPSSTAAPSTSAPSSPTTIAVSQVSLGSVLVNAQGRTLYGFTNDTNGTSSCNGDCADAWPPLIVSADFKVPAGFDAAKLHTIKRDDGQLQLAAGKWPLYTFAADSAAGQTKGQGSGGKWFVVNPDGSLNKTAAPAAAPGAPAAAPTTMPAAPATPAATHTAAPAATSSGY